MGKNNKVYTITQAAKVMGVERQTVGNWVRDKKIKTLDVELGIECDKKLISANAINEFQRTKK